MVVRTSPLGSLKRGFLPQIHHPLPMTRHESQHLLNSITTSFRRNLDQEHPISVTDDPATTASAAPTSTLLVTAPAPNRRPTDRHLRTILANPLFASIPDAQTNPTTTTTKNPFDVFDLAVSKGMMNTTRAAGFLATVRSHLSAEAPAEPLTKSRSNLRSRMAASGAGRHVVRWLRSSGTANDLAFLHNRALINHIVPFLYAEGLSEIVWDWLAQLAAGAAELELADTPGQPDAKTLSHLMSTLINQSNNVSYEDSTNLDDSYTALTKANDMLPREHPIVATIIKNTWASLSWASTVDASKRPPPSVSRFENFLDLGRPMGLTLDLAHLDLHHPTKPTHSAAMEYLRFNDDIVDNVSYMKPRTQRRILCLVLDAAEQLKQTGYDNEASSWIERVQLALYERLNLPSMLKLQTVDALDSNRPIHPELLKFRKC
ncbi:hypothetical protein GGR57DRAFT_504409 [Xylariaceae sp. FL1272]|nr:hypothetical protein GGR57DRAFT_504409 [Xylariaceae sp. FL1272]